MDLSGFMHKYYDWSAFEAFVRELYTGDGDSTVQHNVTQIDRYGAKRQIDVKIVRRSRFHTFTTLVECKRWKEPVSRDRIDVLASGIEALGAQNGAIFTTTGFEEGAIAYAKGKGIELFRIRDLTPEEWGLPGRHVSLYLQVGLAEFRGMQFAAQAIALVDSPPNPPAINIDISADNALDPAFDLFSIESGERGPNLVSILGDAHRLLLSTITNLVALSDGGKPAIIEVMARAELDFTKTVFRQLRLAKIAARIERIGFSFCVHIHQSTINVDRGKDLDFAVMVESYVSEQRLIAQRRTGSLAIEFQNDSPQTSGDFATHPDVQNGSLIKVCCSAWIGLQGEVADVSKTVPQLMRVMVETEGATPRLSILAIPTAGAKAGSEGN
jgi:hypothetical protein